MLFFSKIIMMKSHFLLRSFSVQSKFPFVQLSLQSNTFSPSTVTSSDFFFLWNHHRHLRHFLRASSITVIIILCERRKFRRGTSIRTYRGVHKSSYNRRHFCPTTTMSFTRRTYTRDSWNSIKVKRDAHIMLYHKKRWCALTKRHYNTKQKCASPL